VLQEYADRGVFRGLTGEPMGADRVRYRFTWLTRRPTILQFDPRRITLVFPALLPEVGRGSPLARELSSIVAARMSRVVPAHKRLDRRRATIDASVRAGAFSLVVISRGGSVEYSTRYALNLVNELFLLLHGQYPEYLVEHFGMSAE
jgi:hypothetical protein